MLLYCLFKNLRLPNFDFLDRVREAQRDCPLSHSGPYKLHELQNPRLLCFFAYSL